MNSLPPPLNEFRLEKRTGEYKDFGVTPDNPYPLPGVTYPVNYGDVPGFTGEDGANLDIFLGEAGTINGFIRVLRNGIEQGEHKFYVNLTEEEEKAVLETFGLVLIENARFDSLDNLIEAIQPFKNQP